MPADDFYYEPDGETLVDLGGGMRVPLSELMDDEEEECPVCHHGADQHDLDGCGVPGCECPGP